MPMNPRSCLSALLLCGALADWAKSGEKKSVLIERIDGQPVKQTDWGPELEAAGFRRMGKGYLIRRFD